MTGKLKLAAEGPQGMAWVWGCQLAQAGLCCQPQCHNPRLQVIKGHNCIIMGSADSTAEQQLHAMEAAQNTYVASHFPDL